MLPKRSKSVPKPPACTKSDLPNAFRMTLKRSQSDVQVAQTVPMVPPYAQSHSNMTPKSPQSDPKVTIICQHWPRSDAKVAPKSPPNSKSTPKVAPNLPQSHPQMEKAPKSDPKAVPKSTSHIKSDAKMTPKSHSYARFCPKVIYDSP